MKKPLELKAFFDRRRYNRYLQISRAAAAVAKLTPPCNL